MSITIEEVTGRQGINRFVRFPFSLYKGSRYWVPPIISREIDTLDPNVNPGHAGAVAKLFLAYKNGAVEGRIAAIARSVGSDVEGRFGWLDMTDDLDITTALMDSAGSWLQKQGAMQIRGPMGFTNLDKTGLLTFGYDELPTIATIYNHPYYVDHLEALGFEKSADYIEHEFRVPSEVPARVDAFADIIAKRYRLHLPRDFTKERAMFYGKKIFDLINETHRQLYGFIPLSEEVKEYYLRKYIRFISPDFVALVLNEQDDLVGYGLSMPSLSRAFQKCNGKLFPFGFRHILHAKRHVERADLMLIGVTDAMRNKGVTALIFRRMIHTMRKYQVPFVESNPELETNLQVQALWQDYEFRIHKRRRVYQRAL